MPNRGAWLEFELDNNDVISVRVDRTRKIPVTALVRALGYGSDGRILEVFDDDSCIRATLERDNTKTEDEGLVEVYKRLRPGEPPTVDSARGLLENMFLNPNVTIWHR